MPDINRLVTQAERHAKDSWEADGLQAIVLGLPSTIFGVILVLIVFEIIHFEKDSLGGLWTVGLAYLFFFLVLAGHREIVKWLKLRISYPRTGYVGGDTWPPQSGDTAELDWTIRRDPLSGRRFTTLSIDQPSDHARGTEETEIHTPVDVVAGVTANVRSLAAVISRMFWMAGPSIGLLWGKAAYKALGPWLLAIALILTAISSWKRSETGKIAWIEPSALAVAGVAIAVWPFARNHWFEFLALMVLGGGAFLLLRGTITLLRYLRRNPVAES